MARDCRTCKYNGTDDNKCYWCFRHDTELNQRYSKWQPKDDVHDTNVGEMTLISMDEALNVVKDTIAKALKNLPHHYDEEVDDEVYDDMGKVNLLLEVNKEIRANIRKLERRDCDEHYQKAFSVACELLIGASLFGVTEETMFREIMDKEGIVSSLKYEKYILDNLARLTGEGDGTDHGII